MSEPFMGEVRNFAFTFTPLAWAQCNGQLLSIQQNSALFSLLGTTYGGDGMTTFALPDLRGRVPVGMGQGPGLTPRVQGEAGGEEAVTLTQAQAPSHTHPAAGSSTATAKSPAAAVPAFTTASSSYGTTQDLAMSPTMVGPAGGNQPHDNMPPYLGSNWCIAVQGIYPSRP